MSVCGSIRNTTAQLCPPFRLYGDSTTTGSNLVVACVLTDADGTVKYYGKFMDCSDALPETSDLRVSMGYIAYGTYILSIFLHDTATNRISNPSPTMTVEIGGGFGTISNYNGQTYVDAPVLPNTRKIKSLTRAAPPPLAPRRMAWTSPTPGRPSPKPATRTSAHGMTFITMYRPAFHFRTEGNPLFTQCVGHMAG